MIIIVGIQQRQWKEQLDSTVRDLDTFYYLYKVVALAVLGGWLDLMILKTFSSLVDSVIPWFGNMCILSCRGCLIRSEIIFQEYKV